MVDVVISFRTVMKLLRNGEIVPRIIAEFSYSVHFGRRRKQRVLLI
jgi:hypothetical protein